MGRLIIDGNSVYEVDEDCLKQGHVPPDCEIREAIERQEKRQAEIINKEHTKRGR